MFPLENCAGPLHQPCKPPRLLQPFCSYFPWYEEDLNPPVPQSMSANSDRESVWSWLKGPVNWVSGKLGKKGVDGGV